LLAGLLALAGGCSAFAGRARSYRIIFTELQGERVAVLQQIVSLREGVHNGGKEWPESVTKSSFCEAGAGLDVRISPGRQESVPIGWDVRTTDSRLVFFAPGRVVTTIYPSAFRGRDEASRRHMERALLGWRRNIYRPLSVFNGLPLGPSREVSDSPAEIALELRRLKSAGRIIQPSSMGDSPPAELTDADALNFIDQLGALNASLSRRQIDGLNDLIRELILTTIDRQYEALEAAEFADLIHPRATDLIEAIRRQLQRAGSGFN
jgi:hypothetical protein